MIPHTKDSTIWRITQKKVLSLSTYMHNIIYMLFIPNKTCSPSRPTTAHSHALLTGWDIRPLHLCCRFEECDLQAFFGCTNQVNGWKHLHTRLQDPCPPTSSESCSTKQRNGWKKQPTNGTV